MSVREVLFYFNGLENMITVFIFGYSLSLDSTGYFSQCVPAHFSWYEHKKLIKYH